eukprot:180599_1
MSTCYCSSKNIVTFTVAIVLIVLLINTIHLQPKMFESINFSKSKLIFQSINFTSNKEIFFVWRNNYHINSMTHKQYCEFMHESVLYIDNCPWSNSTTYKWSILIISTPRSGTTYSTSVLKSIGINVMPDNISPFHNKSSDGHISWIHSFYEPIETVYPFLTSSRLFGGRFKHIFHQIREPLHSLTSMCTEPIVFPKYNRFLINHINLTNITNSTTSVEIVMQFWYEWHVKLNLFGFPIFKVENLYSMEDNKTAINTLNWIANTAELKHVINDTQLLNGNMSDNLYTTLHIKVNKRRHRNTLTWDELFLLNQEYAMKIWKLANEYGYQYNWNYNVFDNETRYTHPFAANPKHHIKCDCYYFNNLDSKF